MRNSVRWLIVGVLLFAAASHAQAQTYYVAKTTTAPMASNSNTCAQAENINTPKLTISGATGGLSCINNGGDVLLIRAGTYNEAISNNVASGTSWSNFVRIANYNGETVWVTPLTNTPALNLSNFAASYIEFDGLNFDTRNTPFSTAVVIQGSIGANAHHIRVKNAEIRPPNNENCNGVLVAPASGTNQTLSNWNEFINITTIGGGGGSGPNANGYAMYIAASNTLVDGGDFSDSRGGGLQVYNGSSGQPNNVIVRNSRIHDITRSKDTRVFGIILSGNNHKVYNNFVYDIDLAGAQSGQGAIVAYGASGALIYNNTVADNSATIGIVVDVVAAGTIVRNNLTWNNNGGSFTSSGSNTTVDNNSWQDIPGQDPLFVSAAAENYHIQSSSPAINQGTNIAAVTTTVVCDPELDGTSYACDFDGEPRPQGSQYDLGADEFASTPPVDPAIEITSPTVDTAFSTQTTPLATLAGTCTDEDGTIASTGVTWSNSGGGSGTASVTGGGTASVTWSVSSIVLVNDAQTITVTCTDNDARTHQDSLTVTYTAPSQPAQPGGKRLRLTP